MTKFIDDQGKVHAGAKHQLTDTQLVGLLQRSAAALGGVRRTGNERFMLASRPRKIRLGPALFVVADACRMVRNAAVTGAPISQTEALLVSPRAPADESRGRRRLRGRSQVRGSGLIAAVAVEHLFEAIPGWFKFAPAYARAVAETADGALFVEVGSFKGRSTAYLGIEILNSGKRIALHCVDYWNAPDEPDLLATFSANLASLVSKGLSLTLHREPSTTPPRALRTGRSTSSGSMRVMAMKTCSPTSRPGCPRSGTGA